MDPRRFDRLTATFATAGSRRRVLAALLVGALGNLRLHTATAEDESGTVIAEAVGGNANLATVVDPATSPTDYDPDHDHDQDDRNRETCQPESQRERCDGRCGQVVNDGCGGRSAVAARTARCAHRATACAVSPSGSVAGSASAVREARCVAQATRAARASAPASQVTSAAPPGRRVPKVVAPAAC